MRQLRDDTRQPSQCVGVLHTLSCGSVMEMASTFTLVLSVSLLPYLS